MHPLFSFLGNERKTARQKKRKVLEDLGQWHGAWRGPRIPPLCASPVSGYRDRVSSPQQWLLRKATLTPCPEPPTPAATTGGTAPQVPVPAAHEGLQPQTGRVGGAHQRACRPAPPLAPKKALVPIPADVPVTMVTVPR